MHASMVTRNVVAGPDPPGGGWGPWLTKQMEARGWNDTDLANAGGFDRSLINRWTKQGKAATIDKIRAVCHALGRDVREGLVAAGLFTPEELRVAIPGPPDWGSIADDDLLREVKRRMSRGLGDADDDAKLFSRSAVNDGELVHLGTQHVQEGEVIHMGSHRENSQDDEDAVRSPTDQLERGCQRGQHPGHS